MYEILDVSNVLQVLEPAWLVALELVRTALALHRSLTCCALHVAGQLLHCGVHTELAARRKHRLAAYI
jgi:hypothetical protein